MATWKGLSSRLIVQIVTHLSMEKVAKFEKLFSFLSYAAKTAQGDGSPPLPVEIGLKYQEKV